jgi:hypothetical protein
VLEDGLDTTERGDDVDAVIVELPELREVKTCDAESQTGAPCRRAAATSTRTG